MRERRHVTPCLSSAPSSTGYCEPVCGQRKIDRFGVKICTLTFMTSERSGTTDCSGTKKCGVMFKLCQREPVCEERETGRFWVKIWVVNMLSVRWERGACAVALMLWADVTQMERRLHNAQPIYMYKWNLQSSRYTDAISHEFHKNGKTYQNTDNMSLSGMKQLLMWPLQKITKITGKWISRSIFLELHVRLHGHILNSIHCTDLYVL